MAGYLPFFGVTVTHGFYGGAWPQLDWRPQGGTARLLARAGCVAGPSRDGLAVYFDGERRKLLASCLADAREPMDLRWELHAPGLPLASITDGAPTQYGPVLVLSSANAVREDDGGWRLHAGESVDARDWYAPDVAAVTGLVDARSLAPRAPLVRLLLAPDDLPAEGAAGGRQFRIRFAARATVWKYFFVGGDWPAQGLEVVDMARAARFEPPQPERLADGRAALTVRSADPIVLQRQPTQRFQLLRREDGRESVVIARLPTAAAGSLMRDATGGSAALVSEIYV